MRHAKVGPHSTSIKVGNHGWEAWTAELLLEYNTGSTRYHAASYDANVIQSVSFWRFAIYVAGEGPARTASFYLLVF